MKLVSYLKNGSEGAGLISGNKVYDLHMLHDDLPDSMIGILAGWEEYFPLLRKLSKEIDQSADIKSHGLALKDVRLLAPVPHPSSLRMVMHSGSMRKLPEETGDWK